VTPLELLWVQEFLDPFTEARERGARALVQPDLRWQRCDIKSTNLLANVLALQAAKEAGCVEALLVRADGLLTEASHSSFCAVRDGVVITTPDSNAILPGTTRGLVLRLALLAGVAIELRMLHRDELPLIQELFLTGTTTEVLPLVRVDEQVIGTGQPGPVTRSLQQAYRQAVQAFLSGQAPPAGG
jgi:D-alanine transaminase